MHPACGVPAVLSLLTLLWLFCLRDPRAPPRLSRREGWRPPVTRAGAGEACDARGRGSCSRPRTRRLAKASSRVSRSRGGGSAPRAASRGTTSGRKRTSGTRSCWQLADSAAEGPAAAPPTAPASCASHLTLPRSLRPPHAPPLAQVSEAARRPTAFAVGAASAPGTSSMAAARRAATPLPA